MIWDTDQAIEELDEFSAQLITIRKEFNDATVGLDRMQRWQDRLRKWLADSFGSDEARRFSDKCRVPSNFETSEKIEAVFRILGGYVIALQNDIRDDPEHWEDLIHSDTDDDEVDPPETPVGSHVFLGHGKSNTWRQLHQFLSDECGLQVDAFESQSRAGRHIVSVLETLLDSAGFGVLLLTAEDVTDEGAVRARQNVVHETGLFQGRLGFHRVALVMEEGVEEFSNIQGLQQIRFKSGSLEEAFPELRRMMVREGVLED